MKKHYFLTLFAAFAVFSCKKEKDKDKVKTEEKTFVCTDILLAQKPKPDGSYELIGVDQCTGKNLNLGYNFVIPEEAGGRTYNEKGKCFYVLQRDNSRIIQLVKFNVDTKVTDYYPYSGVMDKDNYFYNGLAYNTFTNEFYLGFTKTVANGRPVSSSYYRFRIGGDTCSEENFHIGPGSPYLMTYCIDDNTGDIYFLASDWYDADVEYIAKLPLGSNTLTKVFSTEANQIHRLSFNKIDNMLYAIKSDRMNYPFTLVRIDPATQQLSTVSSLDFLKEGEYFIFKVDSRNNTCNIYVYDIGIDIVKDIYILEPSTGKILKHLTPNEEYYPIQFISK